MQESRPPAAPPSLRSELTVGRVTKGPDGEPALSGRFKHQVIRHLALKDITRVKIARKYGVTPQAVTLFAHRHRFEIEEARLHIDDEYISLWSAKKTNRLAEMEEMAEILDESIQSLRRAGQYDADLVRSRAALFKQISEELGQLPPRQQVVSASVTHTVEGFDSEELRGLLT